MTGLIKCAKWQVTLKMKGKYKIVIHDTNVRYELELERNITIIKGKSGTGKSNLYRMND